MTRSLGILTAALLVAAPAAAQQHQHQHGADHAQHANHPTPEGWRIRTDRDQPVEQVRLMAMDGHFHVITGPAAVLYRPEWTRSGDFRVAARFTQNKAPAHPEAFGLVVGGRELDGANQQYAYLLVRGTGEYFIATRRGDQRTKLVDWTAHPAIAKQDANGQASNVLAVEAKGAEVLFYVNGQLVARRPRAEIAPNGIVGFRVNHNLDVKIDQVTR